MTLPGIAETIEFLSRPGAYPEHAQLVEIRKTHISWVFLTETQAWKLKKPVRTPYLDFSTPEARRQDGEVEVTLNRRLAQDVYRGVLALTIDEAGTLQLDGSGKPVDWLVCMRRLPADRMLDHILIHHNAIDADLSKLALLLAAFYKTAPPILKTGSECRNRLAIDLKAARAELSRPEYGLSADLITSVITPQLEFLGGHPAIFDARVRAGKIIEAHGDLRPEHICLETPPVIIDCLEFNRDLRILDAASELTFLSLECERLGAMQVGRYILDKYGEETGDRPPSRLLDFYKSYHAAVRAQIALWHLADDNVRDRAHWVAKANRYLEIAIGGGSETRRRLA
jgi:aminoglycoside phosphotransferase family enzyme